MKKIFSIKIFLLLSIMAFGLSSCESDPIRVRLIDAQWEGDLYKSDSRGFELYSVFTFNTPGIGYEEIYYKSNDKHFATDEFSWNFVYDKDDYIVLNYRDGGQEFFDRVNFDSSSFSAIHYLNPRDFENRKGGKNVILHEYYRGRY